MIFPAATLLLIGAYCWNFGMGLIHVLLPLYAYHLNLSGVAIGSIISLPALLQIVLRLTAGTGADRWGEKKLLVWTYVMIALAGPAFFLADSYLLLLAAQALPILSRAT